MHAFLRRQRKDVHFAFGSMHPTFCSGYEIGKFIK